MVNYSKIIECGDYTISHIEKSLGKNKGAFLLNLFNIILYTGIFILVSHLKFPIGIALILRGSFVSLVLFFIAHCKSLSLTVEGKDFKHVIIRSVCISIQQIMMIWGCKHIPTSTVLTINCLGPIFIQLIQGLFYQKKISNRVKLSTLISFIGVYLITNRNQQQNTLGNIWVCLLVTISIFVWAYGILQVNFMSESTSAIQVSFYLAIFLLLSGFLLTSLQGLQINIYWPIPIIGFGWMLSHNLFTLANMWASSKGSVFMLNYVGVALSFIFEVLVINQKLSYKALIGTCITAIGLAVIVFQ